MAKKEETKFDNAVIYLEGGDEVKLKYPEDCFEEVFEELLKVMKTGEIFSLDASYDVDMQLNGNYLSGLNGKKIVGYDF